MTFNGRPVKAYPGDTVACALMRAGVRVFSRSTKFRRPRGCYCGSGMCFSCAMRVDGIPGVRTCITEAKEGMVIESERGFPSTSHDFLSFVDHVFRKELDYRSRFIRPGFMVPVYQSVVRRLASSSRLPDDIRGRHRIEEVSCDVAVVGQGVSGSVASSSLRAMGVKHVLSIDSKARGGGVLEGTAFAVFEDGSLGVLVGSRVLLVRARAVLLATGRYETGIPLVNADLPGTMLPGAVHMLVSRHIPPGRSAFLVGKNERKPRTVRELEAVGTSIVGEVEDPSRVSRLLGGSRVRGLELAEPTGRRRKIQCDAVVLFGELVPAVGLAQQAGCRLRSKSGQVCVETDSGGSTTVPGFFACGGVTGLSSPADRISSAQSAALSVARFLGVA